MNNFYFLIHNAQRVFHNYFTLNIMQSNKMSTVKQIKNLYLNKKAIVSAVTVVNKNYFLIPYVKLDTVFLKNLILND